MKPRGDWYETVLTYTVFISRTAAYGTVLMFLFASLHKQFGVMSAMGWWESLAWGAAWSMVVALRRGK